MKNSIIYSDVITLLKNIYHIDNQDIKSYTVDKILKNLDNAVSISIIDESCGNIAWKNRFDNKKVNNETVIESFTNSLFVYQLFMTYQKLKKR